MDKIEIKELTLEDIPDYVKVNNEAVGMTGIGKSTYEKYEDIGELYSLYLLNKVKKKEYGKINNN